jgi:hypothetical protein
MEFTSLAYLIDLEWLYESFDRTRKDGAVGVDGQDGADYAVNLRTNLESLLGRAKSGTYLAPPVRRVHIPKAGSATETRPLGIPTFEDKVLQRAVVMVLEAVYEEDFLDCSYTSVNGAPVSSLPNLLTALQNSGGQATLAAYDGRGYTTRQVQSFAWAAPVARSALPTPTTYYAPSYGNVRATPGPGGVIHRPYYSNYGDAPSPNPFSTPPSYGDVRVP